MQTESKCAVARSNSCACPTKEKLPKLDLKDWQVILELLESESAELPGEIHHTDNFQMHADLIERKARVNRLTHQIRELLST